jgi:hypothetical protein
MSHSDYVDDALPEDEILKRMASSFSARLAVLAEEGLGRPARLHADAVLEAKRFESGPGKFMRAACIKASLSRKF